MKKYLFSILILMTVTYKGFTQCENPTVVSIELHDPGQHCSDSPITFTVTSTGEGTTPVYQWYLGTTPIGTNNSLYTFVPTMADHGKKVTVTLTSSDACNTGVAESNIVFLNLVQSEAPSVTIEPLLSGPCTIDTWAYTIKNSKGFGTAPIPQWVLNDVPLDKHDNTISVTPKNGDKIYATMTSSLICIIGPATVQSNTITIDEVMDCGTFSLPISGPALVKSGQQNVVYSVPNLPGSVYTWEVQGGTLVKGQNTNSITVDWGDVLQTMLQTREQNYITLHEVNAGNFSHTSSINIGPIATSITKSLAQSGISLFPNPAAESFNIDMPASGVAVSYEILDLTGASVAQGSFISTGTAEKITAHFGAGLYQVVLRYNDVVTTGRLSKVQ